VRRRTTHAAHQTSAPVTLAFIEIEQALSATSSAEKSSSRAFRVGGKAIEHVGYSARRHTNTGMRTQRIMGSGGITPTVLRSSAALFVVHSGIGALGARFAPRELQCEQPCILRSSRGSFSLGLPRRCGISSRRRNDQRICSATHPYGVIGLCGLYPKMSLTPPQFPSLACARKRSARREASGTCVEQRWPRSSLERAVPRSRTPGWPRRQRC